MKIDRTLLLGDRQGSRRLDVIVTLQKAEREKWGRERKRGRERVERAKEKGLSKKKKRKEKSWAKILIDRTLLHDHKDQDLMLL